MRSRLLVALAALAVVVGVGVALFLGRTPPSGSLLDDVTDVTIVAPAETIPDLPVAPPPGPDVDVRCWRMFGGDP